MSQPISTAAAAEQLRISHSWAQKLCSRHGIGTEVTPRMRVLSPADVKKLERAIAAARKTGRGRPKKNGAA